MTLCFFSAQYLPTVGGVERYTYNLAKRLTAAGHTVFVVTSALPGLPQAETTPEGIRVVRLPVWAFMRGRFPCPKPGASALLAPVWAAKPDACILQTRFYPSSVYAAFAGRRRHIPLLVIDHSTGHMPMGSAPLNLAAALYEHLACALIRSRGAAFTGVSQAVCGWLRHFHVRPKAPLYNAVSPAELQQLADAPPAVDWRARLGLAPDAKLIAFVGRIIPEKGVGPLMEAFQSLHRTDTALLIAGDGPARAALEARSLPGVYFLGSVPYTQTLQLYRQATVYCLPTLYAEGFPTTFLEAAALGCPIVTTVTGGSAELMPDGRYGIQLPDAAVIPLAEALAKALEDPAWRQTAADLTLKNLQAHFTWDAVTADLLTLLKEKFDAEIVDCHTRLQRGGQY